MGTSRERLTSSSGTGNTTPAICATSSTRVRAPHGCFPASPPSDSSGVTSPSSHGAPPALPPCATRTAAHVRNSGVTMAERAGVSPAVLRAVLADDPDAMPPDVALVWKFTRATLAHDAAADEYREAIVKRWGRRGAGQSGFCHHRGANLSNSQVRPWPRQGLHARRRWRHAGDCSITAGFRRRRMWRCARA